MPCRQSYPHPVFSRPQTAQRKSEARVQCDLPHLFDVSEAYTGVRRAFHSSSRAFHFGDTVLLCRHFIKEEPRQMRWAGPGAPPRDFHPRPLEDA